METFAGISSPAPVLPTVLANMTDLLEKHIDLGYPENAELSLKLDIANY